MPQVSASDKLPGKATPPVSPDAQTLAATPLTANNAPLATPIKDTSAASNTAKKNSAVTASNTNLVQNKNDSPVKTDAVPAQTEPLTVKSEPQTLANNFQQAQASAQSSHADTATPLAPANLVTAQPLSSLNTHATQGDQPAQTISTPLGQAGWGDEFTQKVTWISTQKNQTAELHLNPPDLGPLNVVIKISDNQATAAFTSPHSAVRDAVEHAMPKLREMLADSGIALGNATVSDQPARDNNAAAFTGQQSQQQGSRWTTQNPDRIAPAVSIAAASPTRQRHHGMVDTFA